MSPNFGPNTPPPGVSSRRRSPSRCPTPPRRRSPPKATPLHRPDPVLALHPPRTIALLQAALASSDGAPPHHGHIFFWPAPSPSQRHTNLPIRQRRMRGRTAPSDCGPHVAHRLLHRRRLMPKSTRRRSGRGRCHPRRASFRLPELHASPSHAAAGQGATLLAIGSPTKADGGHTLTSRRRRQRVETARQPSTTADGGRGLRASHAARPSWR